MKPRPFILAETNWKTVKDTHYEIAVLPWGATEAHNFHLPYGTDNIQNDYISIETAKLAWEKGAQVIVLPNIPFGANCQQLDIKLTINMNPSTQFQILNDVIESLYGHDIKKLVIMNGHGGNDFKQMIRELKSSFPDMFISQLNWFKVLTEWDSVFEDLGDHAGEMETSIMLKIAPDWVLPLNLAGDGAAKSLKFRDRSEGWLWAPREWTKVTRDTGIGDPAKSTVAKGEQCLRIVIEKMAEFLVELHKVDINDIYE